MNERIFSSRKYRGEKISTLEEVLETSLKNQSKLDFEKLLWHSFFCAYSTETEVVDRLLAYDDELKKGYTYYQDFFCTIIQDFMRYSATRILFFQTITKLSLKC